MAIFKTRYFGDIEVDDKEDTVEIETTIREGGEEKEVSIVIDGYVQVKDRMAAIVQVLDQYLELHEAVKAYIDTHHREDEGMLDFLFIYAAQAGKKEYKKNGNKVMIIDLDKVIRHLDLPAVLLQEYKGGRIMAQLTYGCADITDCLLVVTIDKDGTVYSVKCYPGREGSK
jgi:hypothetical protein